MADNPSHLTLSAGVATTVTFTENFGYVEVLNVDGAGAVPVYFTADGSTPTVGGNGCNIVLGSAGAFLVVADKTSGATVVKVISAGTPKISVRGI